MRHSIFVMAILMVVSPIICGPALSNEPDSVYISSQQMISILHSCLNHARQVLETQVDLTQDYQEQVYLLTSILQDIEN